MSEENKNEVATTSKSIVLSEGSIQKVDRWLEQVDGKRVQLSRKEFLNWFIEKSPENLSNSDLNTIVERYYDEEKFLRQLLRETKQAKRDGQPAQLEIVVRPRKSETKREAAPAENDEISEENASLS
jgi:hypothetical protein